MIYVLLNNNAHNEFQNSFVPEKNLLGNLLSSFVQSAPPPPTHNPLHTCIKMEAYTFILTSTVYRDYRYSISCN